MIQYTDYADFTDLHGFSLKKSVSVRVIREIRVQKVLITAIPNEPINANFKKRSGEPSWMND